MPDSAEEILSALLSGAVGEVDIPTRLVDQADRMYAGVGDHFRETIAGNGDWHIYPQGSVRLGTVVRPSANDEYDLDTVAKLDVNKEDITKAELKKLVGDALKSYVAAHLGEEGEPTAVHPRKRCWTLEFADQFRMDVLPAVTRPMAAPHGIHITDRALANGSRATRSGSPTGSSSELARSSRRDERPSPRGPR